MSLLSLVSVGRKLKPVALMGHAPHGIGKSTFASEAPKPIYIGNEENDELDVARFPKIVTWNDLENQLRTLRDESHDFRTLVIDTIDGLEQVAEMTILSEKNNAGKTMATAYGGYGKAYEKMANMFLNIRDNYLIPLRDKNNMNIIILAHSKKVKHEDPMTNTSYDHYETAIHKSVKPIFEDWVSAIFFMNYYLVRAESSSGKEYAESDGFRMIYTEERPSHVAKNRFNLPYEIEFEKEGTYGKIRNMILAYFKSGKVEHTTGIDFGKRLKSEEPKKEVEPTKEPEPKKEVQEPVNTTSEHDLMAEINEMIAKMPQDMIGGIETSIKRAKGERKELERIKKKMQGLLA